MGFLDKLLAVLMMFLYLICDQKCVSENFSLSSKFGNEMYTWQTCKHLQWNCKLNMALNFTRSQAMPMHIPIYLPLQKGLHQGHNVWRRHQTRVCFRINKLVKKGTIWDIVYQARLRLMYVQMIFFYICADFTIRPSLHVFSQHIGFALSNIFTRDFRDVNA